MRARIRVDKLLMLGVAGLGIYAVVRMVKTTSAAQLPPGGSKPVPLAVPTGNLPDTAGPIPPAPASLSLDATPAGQPLKLTGGRWYHGRLEFPNAAVPNGISTREQINALLRGMGFGREASLTPRSYDVQVFTTPLEASKSIFQEFALANPGKGTRWFLARWPLSLEVSVPDPIRPPGMVLLWKAASPSPEMVPPP